MTSYLLDLPLPPLPAIAEQESKAQELRHAYEIQRAASAQLTDIVETAEQAWGPSTVLVQDRSLPVANTRMMA